MKKLLPLAMLSISALGIDIKPANSIHGGLCGFSDNMRFCLQYIDSQPQQKYIVTMKKDSLPVYARATLYGGDDNDLLMYIGYGVELNNQHALENFYELYIRKGPDPQTYNASLRINRQPIADNIKMQPVIDVP